MTSRRNPLLTDAPRYAELAEQLRALLVRRNLGLITQAEYETDLEGVESSLFDRTTLAEHDLQGGGTRYLLRNRLTSELLASFEFQPYRSPDR
jgi:hypothetical protein